MLRYWTRGEPVNRIARRIWFIVLILGNCYGAILYYALVYAPAVRRRNRELAEEVIKNSAVIRDPKPPYEGAHREHRAMKISERVLLSGWLLFLLVVILLVIFPKPASHVFHSFAPYFQVVPILLLIGTAMYGVIRLYRFGMQ